MNYKSLLPLILLCMSFPSNAEERWFEVELLLFQRNTDINRIKEDLIVKDISLDTKRSANLINAEVDSLCVEGFACLGKEIPVLIEKAQFATQENGFVRLDNKSLQLSEPREKLKAHASFTPLLHLAWRMPVASRNAAVPIHLFAGKNFAQQSEQATTDKWAVDGNFKVYLDHYLYIDSQLLIRQETIQDVIVKLPEQSFEIANNLDNVQVLNHHEVLETPEITQEKVIVEALFDQSRRLRSEEIHYFDHPLIGMIVQIRKIPAKELDKMKQLSSSQELSQELAIPTQLTEQQETLQSQQITEDQELAFIQEIIEDQELSEMQELTDEQEFDSN